MAIRFRITPENYDGQLSVEAAVDGRVANLDVEPSYQEKQTFDQDIRWNKWAKSIHLNHKEASVCDDGVYLEVETKDRGETLGYYSVLKSIEDSDLLSTSQDHKYVSQTIQMSVHQGTPVEFSKHISIFTSRDVDANQVKASCRAEIKAIRDIENDDLFKEHFAAWEEKWNDCSVEIEGDDKANHAMKFNIYHLLIAANPKDEHANIGAKSLTGEGYKGHVFWDTEVFLLPFYSFTQPESARSLMMYRYNTREGAKEYALDGGYEGIRYPWESADTGHEVTPPWTSDGKVRIWTAERELHITSAVAFGLVHYATVSGDTDFMVRYGAEILFQTARFWVSRLEYNHLSDQYELTGVEGPDEFHDLVNNNVYTNALTKWNLERASEIFEFLSKNYPEELDRLIDKMYLSDSESELWSKVAQKIYIPFDSSKDLVEQFEGYFKLKDVPIVNWNESNMPEYPEGYDHDCCQDTQLLKQPDVLMLMYILPDMFDAKVKKANYQFYEPKTMHKSSLSPSIHAIMGIETDNFDKALQYFERSLYVDLEDNQGNSKDGIHIASCGGSWQALVCGFGGLRVKQGELTFKPWLPDRWKSICFKLKWKGSVLKVRIDHHQIELTHCNESQKQNKHWSVEVNGKSVLLVPGSTQSILL